MKPPIRLIALDIDGTLLDPNFHITAANLIALRRAHEAGVEVVLGTGRRHRFALPVATELGFDCTMITSNGAVTKSSSGELFHRDLLPAAVARRLCLHMRPFRHHLVLTFDRDDRGAVVMESLDELNRSISRWMEKNSPWIERVTPLEDCLIVDPIQAMFCGSIAQMRDAEALLARGDYAAEITVLKTQYEARDLCIVDVLNQACSKGHALRRWAQHRGIPAEQIVAIGDNYNDLEMLEFAGYPFIMGNASEELKQNGWPVTLANDQNGVAAALELVGI